MEKKEDLIKSRDDHLRCMQKISIAKYPFLTWKKCRKRANKKCLLFGRFSYFTQQTGLIKLSLEVKLNLEYQLGESE